MLDSDADGLISAEKLKINNIKNNDIQIIMAPVLLYILESREVFNNAQFI